MIHICGQCNEATEEQSHTWRREGLPPKLRRCNVCKMEWYVWDMGKYITAVEVGELDAAWQVSPDVDPLSDLPEGVFTTRYLH